VTVLFAPAAAQGLARLPLLPAVTAGSSGQDRLLPEAVFLASRQAGAAIRSPDRGGGRFAAVLRAYEIRARSRPTPHGAFAGVAPVRFVPGPASLHLGDGHTARTYPTAAWLAEIATQVLDDPAVFASLTLTTSGSVGRRGPRYEVDRPGPSGHERVTIRATDAATSILARCGCATAVTQVAGETATRWNAAPAAVLAMLRSLVGGGFLLTDLLDTDATADPLGKILAHLPADSPTAAPLRSVRSLLVDADRHAPGDPARLAALRAARDIADAVAQVEQPLAADVRADASLRLPPTLADQAAQAASVLWQTGARGDDPFAGWHARFLTRYGAGRAVPLLDAVDPVAGLGADMPDHDQRPDPARQAALLRLVTDAVAHGRLETVLDRDTIRAIEGAGRGADGDDQPPRTADIFAQVLRDPAGRHFLAVTGAAADAGATRGRFTRLVPPAPADEAEEPWLVAELLVAPAGRSGPALAPPTGQTALHIPVGVPAHDGALQPGDLVLVSDGHRLTVWSPQHDRPVLPVLYSRLSAHLLPPLARFLQLAGRAGSRPLRPWSWDTAGLAPFQPRVRYGPTVLAPARWVLPAALLDAGRDTAGWASALTAWRATARPAPPTVVLLDDADRRLPLDLDRPDDRELLRRSVQRGVHAVTEQPGGADAVQAVVPGPDGAHLLEVVIPLRRRQQTPPPPRPAPAARHGDAGLHLPGGRWLSLAIPAPVPCQDDVLREIAAVADEAAERIDRWFWLRYATPTHGPHLRVRFHGDPEALGGQVLPAVARRCAGMSAARLCGRLTVEPYDQEIERYGGPVAIAAAETVFAADSALVLQILHATTDPDDRLLAAASAAASIARAVADADLAALTGRAVTRASRRRLTALRPQARAAGPAAIRGANAAALTDLYDALAAYRAVLPQARRPACASTLIHMHANRLLADTADEPLARALAADLLAPR
jgi:thiopeptide-type bacteriocin biosynthesis protein